MLRSFSLSNHFVKKNIWRLNLRFCRHYFPSVILFCFVFHFQPKLYLSTSFLTMQFVNSCHFHFFFILTKVSYFVGKIVLGCFKRVFRLKLYSVGKDYLGRPNFSVRTFSSLNLMVSTSSRTCGGECATSLLKPKGKVK